MLLHSSSLALLAFSALSWAQSPPGSSPATNNSLSVTYGSKAVTPGIMLAKSDVAMIPTIVYPGAASGQLYTLLLLDLDISTSQLDPSKLAPAQLPVAPGLGQNRTTLLHFWQAGLQFTSNGTLSNSTSPVAFYIPPSPPPGDIPHIYVFYLFKQEQGFQSPPADSPFSANNVIKSSMNRMSFNIQNFTKQQGVGTLLASNYIRVQNNQTSSTTSSMPSASATASAPAAKFSGGATTLMSKGCVGSTLAAVVVALMAGL